MAMPLPTIRLCKTETFLVFWTDGCVQEVVAYERRLLMEIQLYRAFFETYLTLSNCSDPFFTLDTILVVCSYMHAVPTFYQVAICFKEGKNNIRFMMSLIYM